MCCRRCQHRRAKCQTLHEMPVVQAPYFYPARDGGKHQQTRTNKYRRLPVVRAPYFYPAQDGGRPQDQDGKTSREAPRQSRCKVTQRNAQQPPNARASSTKDHTAPNPRQKDKPELPGERQKVSTNRGSPMTPAGKNSRTVTPLMPVPPTEKQVHTLAFIPPATYIRTVSKGTSITCTVNPSRRKGEFSNPRHLRTKAAAALQTNARQTTPYLYPARDGGNNPTWRQNKGALYLYPARDGGKPA